MKSRLIENIPSPVYISYIIASFVAPKANTPNFLGRLSDRALYKTKVENITLVFAGKLSSDYNKSVSL